jgi:hypothetical protein
MQKKYIMPSTAGNTWMQAGAAAAGGAVSMGIQRLGVNYNNRKQYAQQEKLSNLQIGNESRLMDIQNQKQLEFWKSTSYSAQKEQMQKAGLNPALMYGMGGGGGQTVGSGTPSVTTATADNPKTSQSAPQVMGIALQSALIKAQTENIQADTANKIKDANLKGVQAPNVEQDTHLKWQTTHKAEMDNLIQEVAQATDEKGNNTHGDIQKSAAVQQMQQTIEEQSKRIELIKQQGLTQEEQQKKITEETQLLKNQVDWEALNITGDNIGKTIEKIIKMLLH